MLRAAPVSQHFFPDEITGDGTAQKRRTSFKTSYGKHRARTDGPTRPPSVFVSVSANGIQRKSTQKTNRQTLSHPRERRSRFLNPWKCSKTSTVARAPPPSQLMVPALQSTW